MSGEMYSSVALLSYRLFFLYLRTCYGDTLSIEGGGIGKERMEKHESLLSLLSEVSPSAASGVSVCIG